MIKESLLHFLRLKSGAKNWNEKQSFIVCISIPLEWRRICRVIWREGKTLILNALSNKWIVIAEIRFMSLFKVNQVMCIGWKIRLLLNVIKTQVLRRARHSLFWLYQPRRSISWKGIGRGEWAKDQTKKSKKHNVIWHCYKSVSSIVNFAKVYSFFLLILWIKLHPFWCWIWTRRIWRFQMLFCFIQISIRSESKEKKHEQAWAWPYARLYYWISSSKGN